MIGKGASPTTRQSTGGMRRIFHEADNPADQLLVLGLGAWGLRPDEVASLHVSQFVFDTENDDGSYSDDYIEFEERKNGPGTVNLMFGVDAVQDRIADLEGPGWNGYLFPESIVEWASNRGDDQ